MHGIHLIQYRFETVSFRSSEGIDKLVAAEIEE